MAKASAVAGLVGTGLLAAAACGGGSAGAGPGAAADPSRTSGRTAAPSERTAAPLAGKTVAIDPGHNGGNGRHPEIINRRVDVITKKKACDTTGTQAASGYTEAAFNWDVSRRLAKILKRRGAKVVLTRRGNDGAGPCITERAATGNKAKADAAISIHADGAPAGKGGFHMILPAKIDGPVRPVTGESRRLGIAVRDAVRAGTGIPYSDYRGKRALDVRDDLGGLNLSSVPKVFIECGNMKNPNEAAKMEKVVFRQRLAEALAKGMTDYLG